MSGSDLRASIYDHVDFSHADFTGADIRGLDMTSCDLTGVKMTRTKATHDLKNAIKLSEAQIKVIDWHEDEGEEPDGG